MLQVDMSAEKRTVFGKGAMRQMRMAEATPAVVYSGGQEPMPLQFATAQLFKDLHQDIGFLTQYLADLTRLDDLGLHSEFGKIKSFRRFIIDRHIGELEQGARVRAEVRIVEEGVFFKANVYECGIQPGNKLFDFSQV